MSKKFKDKTCVYCCTAKSATADHVFPRSLFLEHHRANLPKVPACLKCNNKKSELEHYITAVFPFGGRHKDSTTNLESNVPKRLAKNHPLFVSLSKGRRRVIGREEGISVSTTSIPVDGQKIEQWFVFVVKGLAWHHWKVLIGPEYDIEILSLTQHGEKVFRRLRKVKVAHRINQALGDETILYKAIQGDVDPQMSGWEFSIYGGMTIAAEG